jgi:DNA repair protein RadD
VAKLKISSSASPRLDPYPFQKIAINAGLKAYRHKQNSLIVIPTGGGKSLIAAEIAGAVAMFGRALIIVPSLDLVLQNSNALRRQFPDLAVSICCAGLGHNDISGPIVIATPGSVVSKKIGFFGALIIDEAHRLPEKKDAVLKRIIAKVHDQSPGAPIIGLTATPYRLKGRLDNGVIWGKIDLEIGYLELLRLGVLAPLVGPLDANLYEMDTTGISKLGGDFNEGQLDKRFNVGSTTASIANDIVRLGANRKTALVFCVSISAAYRMRDALRERGWSCETICEKTSTEDRIKFLDDLRSGKLRAITNVATLTTGVDVPGIDLIALCRPTISTGLHVQILGRGTRIAAGKADCLILDFAGNISRCGPINAPIIKEEKGATNQEPTHRQCPACGFYSAPRAKSCESCDHEFPIIARPRSDENLRLTADRKAAPVTNYTSAKTPANHYRVTDWRFSVHRKIGSPDSLRIEYFVQGYKFRSTSQWVAAWHPKGWGGKAAWAELLRDGATRILPKNAQDAAELAPSLLKRPDFIRIVDDGGMARVIPVANSNAAGLSQ